MFPRQRFSIAALLLTAPSIATAQTRTWTDGDLATWGCVVHSSVNGSTVTCAQLATGGNPDACYRVRHDVTNMGSITAAHTSSDPAATFDPLTEGPFGTVQVALDANVLQAATFGNVVAFVLVIEQGGHVYGATCTYDLVFTSEGWARISWEAAPGEFTAPAGAPPLDLASGPPFVVGFLTGNSTGSSGGTAEMRIDNFEVTAVAGGASIGAPFCVPGAANSSGHPGRVTATGVAVAGGQALRLRASCLPDDVFGYFIASTTQALVPGAGGSVGTLCLGGSIGRFDSQVASSGHSGWFAIDVDTLAVPQPTGPVAIQPGATWTFQCWHRDGAAGGATSNFTSAVAVTFQ